MERKSTAVATGLAIGALLVLTACSSNKSNPNAQASTDAGTPKRGGSIVVDVAQDPVTLDPSKEGGYEGNYMAINVRDRLTQLDAKGDLAPSLAESWDVTPSKVTFHLRKGVKFSNGAPFSSADVKYTFDMILSPKNAYAGNYEPFFQSVEAPDPDTFVVNFKQPYQYFLRQMAENSDFGIVPNNWLNTCASACDTTVIGTGPYLVGQWDKGQKLVLERNPNYWNPEQPYLDKITFQVVPDAQTQLLQLQSKQADVLLSVAPSSASTVKNMAGVTLQTHSGGQTNEVIMNTLIAPFNDERVRQAMYYAIDRKAVIDGALFGLADVPTDLFPSYMEQHDSSLAAPVTDTDKAKSLLAAAGYDDAHPLSFELRTINTSVFTDQATVIKSQLAAIGVKVKVTPMEKGAFLAPMFRDEGSDPKSWQAGLERYSFTSDPQSFSWEQYAKGSAINASNINLPGGAQVPELETVVTDTLAAPDLAAAKVLYGQELKILQSAVPDVRISYQMNLQATTSRVHGYQALSGNQFPLRLVWVS